MAQLTLKPIRENNTYNNIYFKPIKKNFQVAQTIHNTLVLPENRNWGFLEGAIKAHSEALARLYRSKGYATTRYDIDFTNYGTSKEAHTGIHDVVFPAGGNATHHKNVEVIAAELNVLVSPE